LRFLLDTHTLLWADAEDRRLSERARSLIEDPSNQAVLSAVTALELAIKFSAGRLELGESAESFIDTRILAYRLEVLAIEVEHAIRVATLPRLHGDPFDRLLVAQAQVERLPIVTNDPQVARYDVEVIW
jgi:PIN domain nuclease of toxin-antitoxin system